MDCGLIAISASASPPLGKSLPRSSPLLPLPLPHGPVWGFPLRADGEAGRGQAPALTGHCRRRSYPVIPRGLPIIGIVVTPGAGERQPSGGDAAGRSRALWQCDAAAAGWSRVEVAGVGCPPSSREPGRAGSRRSTPRPRRWRSCGELAPRGGVATAPCTSWTTVANVMAATARGCSARPYREDAPIGAAGGCVQGRQMVDVSTAEGEPVKRVMVVDDHDFCRDGLVEAGTALRMIGDSRPCDPHAVSRAGGPGVFTPALGHVIRPRPPRPPSAAGRPAGT
jgi:hypothetical protein